MITIHITYSGTNGNARKFAEEMMARGVVAEIRNEPGNLRYDYFLPFDDQESVLLIDQWENQEALDVHHHLPLMQTIIELREKYNLTMKVERFLSDSEIPESDKKFIKEK